MTASDGPMFSKPSLTNRFLPLSQPDIFTVPASPRPAPMGEARSVLAGSVVVIVFLLVGLGLRTAAFASERCLWVDEAMLALNLVNRSPAQLMQPLDMNQGAPLGYLMLSKLSIELFGPSERPLRLVAFVASMLGFLGFAWMAPRILPRFAATIAIGFLAVSPFIISYTNECKQYSSDAAIAIGLLAVAAGLLRWQPKKTGWKTDVSFSETAETIQLSDTPSFGLGFWRWAILGLAGAMAVWFSHPSAFVLGGIGTALLAQAAVARDRKRFLAVCGTIACWLASFAICYLVSLKQLGTNRYLLDFWAGHFLPMPPKNLGDLAWLLDHFFAFFQYPGGLGGTEIRAGGIGAVLFLVGLYGLFRDRWPLAVAIAVPAGLALLASGLHKYPFSGRLLLFLVPLMTIGVARGAWAVVTALRPTQPLAAFLLLGVLASATTVEAYQELRRPKRHEQLAPVLDEVRGQWQPGDRMYLYYGAVPAFTFYTREAGFPADAIVPGTESRTDRLKYRDELLPFRGSPRVWIVFSHRHNNEESLIRAYAESMGKCTWSTQATGAAAYLYDFTEQADPRH